MVSALDDGLDAMVGGDAKRACGDDRFGSAHQHAVAGATVWQPDPAEHLDRGAEVERDGVRQRQDGDGMHGPTVTLYCGSSGSLSNRPWNWRMLVPLPNIMSRSLMYVSPVSA